MIDPTGSPPRNPALLDVEERDGVAVATVRTPHLVDEERTLELGQQLAALVEAGRLRIALDFAEVELLGSAALGRLFGLKRKLAAAQGRLVLCGIRPELLEVFRITRLDTVFEIQPDVAAALARF